MVSLHDFEDQVENKDTLSFICFSSPSYVDPEKLVRRSESFSRQPEWTGLCFPKLVRLVLLQTRRSLAVSEVLVMNPRGAVADTRRHTPTLVAASSSARFWSAFPAS
ncbi:hypothetical protein CPAR01_13800 [Colletotrichum paranaense]|uniref:Uncharacterized protein n=2 Tax=Colletotrichum acutatum species complex TaxID=2707335 RepID=A0ABQ9PEI5_9PEZI|nr:uncharacterized protein CPAR01_13800 [Colletotrichum paranaense]KAK0370472.1 hypothetical protein CLIM01_12165 [Colletotrichum limetticola]KAK1524852.1 hypothetical protein CPAR01_13800 [Colletotrichum paranaense]